MARNCESGRNYVFERPVRPGRRTVSTRISFLTSKANRLYTPLALPQHCEKILIWSAPESVSDPNQHRPNCDSCGPLLRSPTFLKRNPVELSFTETLKRGLGNYTFLTRQITAPRPNICEGPREADLTGFSNHRAYKRRSGVNRFPPLHRRQCRACLEPTLLRPYQGIVFPDTS
jgi:hypothetical protein